MNRWEKPCSILFQIFSMHESNVGNSLGKGKMYPCHRFDAANRSQPMEERHTFRTKSRLDSRRKNKLCTFSQLCGIGLHVLLIFLHNDVAFDGFFR